MQRGPQIGRMAAAIALFVLIGGCGPIIYINQVTRKASAAVDEARAAQAEKYSPYWYTLAVEYLQKAREEAAFADYEAANRFGRRAQAAAEMAKKESIDRAADPSDTTWMPPPSLREKSASAGDTAGDRSVGTDPSEKASSSDDSLAPADDAGDSGLAPVIQDTGSQDSGSQDSDSGSLLDGKRDLR